MAEREEFDYDFFFDETDEFAETELNYVERNEWEKLLDLYEREADEIQNEEDANDLRTRIQGLREQVYEDARNAQY